VILGASIRTIYKRVEHILSKLSVGGTRVEI
jgi:hypothetical protein